jgi:hypothetical protein
MARPTVLMCPGIANPDHKASAGSEVAADAITAHVLTEDEARRIASNIVKLAPRTGLRCLLG